MWISKWDMHTVQNNFRAWFYGKWNVWRWDMCVASFVLSGNSKINALPLCLICVISFSFQSNLYFTFDSYLSAASTHYYFPCLCSWVSTLGFSSPLPHSWSFSLWFLFLQQSIYLFNLMLFSCLSCLCVWFSFSWRLAGKRAEFYLKIVKKKEKHYHACIQSRKSLKIWKNGQLLTNYWDLLSSSSTSYGAMTDASAVCMLLACQNNCKQSAERKNTDGAELVERSSKTEMKTVRGHEQKISLHGNEVGKEGKKLTDGIFHVVPTRP